MCFVDVSMRFKACNLRSTIQKFQIASTSFVRFVNENNAFTSTLEILNFKY